MRAQVELPALGVALLLLTAALILGISLASTALSSAERPAEERRTAERIADQFVSPDSPATHRENVIDESVLAEWNESTLTSLLDIPPEADVRIELTGRVLHDDTGGDRVDGTTVERIVLIENRTRTTLSPSFNETRSVTVPRRSYDTTLSIAPADGTLVRSVAANDALLLRNETELVGTFDLSISPLETTELRFEGAGPLEGIVEIQYDAAETRKTILSVTVYE